MTAPPTNPEQQIAALESELRQCERDIAMLKETALAVGSELDLDTVLRLVAERARELVLHSGERADRLEYRRTFTHHQTIALEIKRLGGTTVIFIAR